MIRIGKTTLIIVKFRADYGRTYLHEKEKAVCLSCATVADGDGGQDSAAGDAPAYTEACQKANHRRNQLEHVQTREEAPEEAKRAQRLYGRLYRAFHKIAFPCGEQVYLLGKDAPLEETKAALRKEFDDANASFTACRVEFDVKDIVLVPGDLSAETAESLRKDVEGIVHGLLDALHSGKAKEIRAAAKNARELGTILEGQSQEAAGTLAKFAERIAKELKDAADAGDAAVERTVAEAKSGATRFRAIFFDEREHEESSSVYAHFVTDDGGVKAAEAA